MAKKKPTPKIVNTLTSHEQLKKKIAAMEKLMLDMRKAMGKPWNPGDSSKNREV